GPFVVGFGTVSLLIFILSKIDLDKQNPKKFFPNLVYALFTILILFILWSGTRTKIAVTIWDQFFIHFLGG
ncbi:hypothetical protein LJD69_14060, partial [Faecalibacillus faecis]